MVCRRDNRMNLSNISKHFLPPKHNGEFVYRIEDNGNNYYIEEYPIVEETKCYYKVLIGLHVPLKLVSKDAMRPFAYKNKEDALKSYAHRKSKHLHMVEQKVNRLKSIIKQLEKEGYKVETYKLKQMSTWGYE